MFMKFERAKMLMGIGEKYELTPQQFLTFRNTPAIENSGRSVYSQQFDYRSLDKYQHADHQELPAFPFRKNTHQMRSQDKYHPNSPDPALAPLPHVHPSPPVIAPQQRQTALQQQLARLAKQLQREGKREALLEMQIEEVEKELEEGEERRQQQAVDIDELTQISHENSQNHCDIQRKLDLLLDNIHDHQNRLAQLDSEFAATSMEAKTAREKDHSGTDINKQLQNGIKELELCIASLSSNIQAQQSQIDKLTAHLEELSFIDTRIGQLTQL